MTRTRLALVALVALAPAASAQRAVADSLLSVAFEAVGYDRFLNETYGNELPLIPDDVPDRRAVEAAYAQLFTPGWHRERVRSEFLRDHDAADVRQLVAWLGDPVVRRAIAHDYAAVTAVEAGDFDRVRGLRNRGELAPRFVEAARAVSQAAGAGAPALRALVDRAVACWVHTAEALPLESRPARADLVAQGERLVQQFRAEFAEDALVLILVRFETFPVEDLEHYAGALAEPGGQTYLRWVVDAPNRSIAEAVRLALDKSRKDRR